MKAFFKGLIYAFTLCVVACGSAAAQFQPIPNYVGVGAGQKFRNDINNHLSGVTPIAPRIVSLPFAQLPSEQDGQEYWCLDCMRSNPCAGGGAGALAVGQRGAWSCTASGSLNGISNVIEYGADPTGVADSWSALMSAVADACTNNKAVLFPSGKYKVLTPFAPVCSTHPLRIYSDAGATVETNNPGATIQEGFSGDRGPTVILDQTGAISSLNGGNLLTAPAVGSVGKSLSFTNAGAQVPFYVDISDVLPSSGRYLNGLSTFDVRTWVNLASLTTSGGSFGNLIMESAGGIDQVGNISTSANTYEACNVNVGYEGDSLPNTCQGAFGIHTGADGKVFGRLYLTTSGLVHVDSGTTLFAINGWHFVELSYDGANVRLIIDGTLRGNVAATGTVIQRVDESILIGEDFPQFLHSFFSTQEFFNGQLYSPEISNVARSTCGGSTVLGTSCYTNPTTANPGDSNSLFLWNGDLTNLPLNNGAAVPVLEPDRVSGTALNTTTTTAWLHVHNTGLSCCSRTVSLHNLTVSGGTSGISDSAEQIDLDHVTIAPSGFPLGNIGIETSQNGSYFSLFHNIYVTNGIMPLAALGGISDGDNVQLVCQGACLEEGGGTWKYLFFQISSQASWGLIHVGIASSDFLYLDDDSENGAAFVPIIQTGQNPLVFVNPTLLTPGTGLPVFRLEGNTAQGFTVIGGKIAPQPPNVIDAVTVDTSRQRSYTFIGVDTGQGQSRGALPNGIQWVNNSDFNSVGVNTVSEATGISAAQYHLLQGLHVAGPVVGGLRETGAVSLAQLATPTAPIVTVKGAAGATSYTYFCVAHDATSTSVPTGATLPSAGTTITTGNATLSTTNFNQIQCGPQAGVYSWDILKTNTSTSLALAVLGYQAIVNDTGQATAAYTPPARNSTGDLNVAGQGTIGTPWALAYGGNGTATPSLSAGTGLSSTGPWAAQTLSSNAEAYLDFTTGALTALPAATAQIACKKIVKAGTVDNAILTTATFTCATNPTIVVQDCGATAGSCGTPAVIATSTPASATFASITPSSTTLTVGDYVCMNISAGACTVLDPEWSLAFHSN